MISYITDGLIHTVHPIKSLLQCYDEVVLKLGNREQLAIDTTNGQKHVFREQNAFPKTQRFVITCPCPTYESNTKSFQIYSSMDSSQINEKTNLLYVGQTYEEPTLSSMTTNFQLLDPYSK